MAQELLHTMHCDKKEALVMKIDLFKVYYSIDWSYIRLLLLKIGLSIPIICWIMSCITSVRYVVLVNGLPTNFFMAGWGL